MNLNIKQKDCRFYVDKEHGKVVCVISGTRNLFLHHISDCPFGTFTLTPKLIEQLRMPTSFSGVATCSPTDEFDEEYGRLVAFNKMKNKVNTSFFKRANSYINYIDRQLDGVMIDINKIGERLANGADRREKKLQEKFAVSPER